MFLNACLRHSHIATFTRAIVCLMDTFWQLHPTNRSAPCSSSECHLTQIGGPVQTFALVIIPPIIPHKSAWVHIKFRMHLMWKYYGQQSVFYSDLKFCLSLIRFGLQIVKARRLQVNSTSHSLVSDLTKYTCLVYLAHTKQVHLWIRRLHLQYTQ